MISWGVLADNYRGDWTVFQIAINWPPPKGVKHKLIAIAIIGKPESTKNHFYKTLGNTVIEASYKSLADRDDVDAVFCIMDSNKQKYDVIKYCLEKGKHVVIRPPMAMNLKQVQSLTSLARLNQLLLLDAPPALFSPAYDYVRKMIQAGEMGQVLHMEVSALRRNTNGDITNGDCLLLEQGSALLHIAQLVFDDEPQNVKVTAVGKLCQEHDNAAITVILKYTRGRSIVLHIHNKVIMNKKVTIYGTKKYVTMNRIWWVPNEIVTYDVDKDESNVKSLPLPVPRADYVYLLKEVVKCIANEVYESPLTTHKDMENCASLLDEIQKQIGVKFAEDEED